MRITRILILIALCLSARELRAQTYSGGGGVIPDDGTPIGFEIQVSELPFSSIDTLYGLESVCIHIQHTWDADLEIALIAPDGSFIDLVSMLGGDGDNYENTCFNQNSPDPVIFAWAPFTGVYRPLGDLGVVNNGQNGNGTWKLFIYDNYAWADQGTLVSWSLTFGDEPSLPFPFTSSNLPIVVVETFGAFIPDNPKIMARMGIIDNGDGERNELTDPFNGYDGFIGIERRGSSSQWFPKKSFGLETRNIIGEEIEVPLLGMPEESDWILNAHYTDKTLMRNVITYDLARKMGGYASRTRFCELVINGQYWGVYAFMEKIKRDNNRVDIARLEPGDTTGADLTGGYIVKIDKITGSGGAGWTSPFPPATATSGQTIFFQYEYPGADELQAAQAEYIQAYIDTFETALYHFPETPFDYRDYADLGSFCDYFILNELSRNIDGFRLSTFLYKDKEGPLVMGPVWDFDLAWYNAYYCEALNPEGWSYQFGQYCPEDPWQVPFWWDKMMTDSVFTEELRCRWDTWRADFLSLDSLFGMITAHAERIDEGQQRNFVKWPILGVWIWPNPSPVPTTYEGEIAALKLWIMNRLDWMDENVPGECHSMSVPVAREQEWAMWPNPAAERLFIRSGSGLEQVVSLAVYDIAGRPVIGAHEPAGAENGSAGLVTADISLLRPGVYALRLGVEGGDRGIYYICRLFIKK